MKIFRIGALLAASFTMLLAHEELKGKPVTVSGTVVDSGCYFAGEAGGAKHASCAAMCAKNGVPLAVVDESGKVYMVIGNDHKNPNTRLMPFIEKKVKITGTLVEKGGIAGLAIKTVEAE